MSENPETNIDEPLEYTRNVDNPEPTKENTETVQIQNKDSPGQVMPQGTNFSPRKSKKKRSQDLTLKS
jgi:hypothetical protein